VAEKEGKKSNRKFTRKKYQKKKLWLQTARLQFKGTMFILVSKENIRVSQADIAICCRFFQKSSRMRIDGLRIFEWGSEFSQRGNQSRLNSWHLR